jgi:phosphoserine phosphatase
LAVFDVCDTLYACNTTVEFVRYALQSTGDNRGARSVADLARRWSPAFLLGAVVGRLTGYDLARGAVIRRLAGMPRKQIVLLANSFASHVLPDKANAEVHRALARHLQRGDQTILLSNSLDIAVAAIGRVLGVGWLASRVAFDGEICTGRMDHDLQGHKHEALRSFIADRTPYVIVYTDNLTDRPLLEIADERNIVIPKGKSKDKWGQIDATFITL